MIVVLSQRLVGKVQVDSILKLGAAWFQELDRPRMAVQGVLRKRPVVPQSRHAGGAAFLYGLLEQSFIRALGSAGERHCDGPWRRGHRRQFVGLLQTVGIANNVIFGLIGCVGLTVLIVGLGLTRWQGRTDRVENKAGMPKSVACMSASVPPASSWPA
jgi:hypothetical protein